MNVPDALGPVFQRLQEANPHFGKGVMLDVGGNEGQSYASLRRLCPDATIHSFEPAPETFPRLARALADDPKAQAHQLALSIRRGTAGFSKGLGTGNHLSASAPTQVTVTTGDSFCAQHGIPEIDYLKVDTEGYDLDVLAGLTGMLSAGRISHLQVETTPNLDNRFHVHLERFIHFLHPFGYRLSDLTEPTRRVNVTQQPLNGIWFCNAVFALEVRAPKLRRDGKN